MNDFSNFPCHQLLYIYYFFPCLSQQQSHVKYVLLTANLSMSQESDCTGTNHISWPTLTCSSAMVSQCSSSLSFPVSPEVHLKAFFRTTHFDGSLEHVEPCNSLKQIHLLTSALRNDLCSISSSPLSNTIYSLYSDQT